MEEMVTFILTIKGKELDSEGSRRYEREQLTNITLEIPIETANLMTTAAMQVLFLPRLELTPDGKPSVAQSAPSGMGGAIRYAVGAEELPDAAD